MIWSGDDFFLGVTANVHCPPYGWVTLKYLLGDLLINLTQNSLLLYDETFDQLTLQWPLLIVKVGQTDWKARIAQLVWILGYINGSSKLVYIS